MAVTRENATHTAMGFIGEPLDIRVLVLWIAGGEEFMVSVWDDDTERYQGSYRFKWESPLGSETIPDMDLDTMVHEALHPHALSGSGWTTDTVSLAAWFALEWGYEWRDR
jgi:hypothetical protein